MNHFVLKTPGDVTAWSTAGIAADGRVRFVDPAAGNVAARSAAGVACWTGAPPFPVRRGRSPRTASGSEEGIR